MKEHLKRFENHLEKMDREKCIQYIKKLLDKKDIPYIYENILSLALKNKAFNGVWKEHAMTSIVMNCIDICYEKIMETKEKSNGKKVVVLCPEEEHHELGARMVNDFLVLLGYQTTYIGCNTPESDVVDAVKTLEPDYLVISITNPYHLFKLKSMISNVKNIYDVEVIVGGQAFTKNRCCSMVGADYCIKDFEGLKKLKGGD